MEKKDLHLLVSLKIDRIRLSKFFFDELLDMFNHLISRDNKICLGKNWILEKSMNFNMLVWYMEGQEVE